MKKLIFKTFTEYCPVAGCEKTVRIEYEEVVMTKSLQETYKAVSHNCNHSASCPAKPCEIVKNNSPITI